MDSGAHAHAFYRVANTRVLNFPYPHCYVENIFPDRLYEDIQKHIPDPSAMLPISEARRIAGYKERFILQLGDDAHMERIEPDKRDFWRIFGAGLLSGDFAKLMINKFRPYLEQRYDLSTVEFSQEAMLVEDITKYKLGPHTDSPRKAVTVVIYLPKDHSQSHLGTSIYIPKVRTDTCPGGPHHSFEYFDRVATMPFVPNSMFCFVKTNNSFHGVEPLAEEGTKRWLLLFDVSAPVEHVRGANA